MTNSRIEARIFYHPEMRSYVIDLIKQGSEEHLTSVKWILAPDVVPDRHLARAELIGYLQELGVPMQENNDRLH